MHCKTPETTPSTCSAGVVKAARALVALVACALLAAAMFPVPAQGAAQRALASQPAASHAVGTAAGSSPDVYVYGDGERFYQGAGVTWLYDVDGLVEYRYEDGWRCEVSVSDAGVATYEPVADYGSRFSITAQQAGEVTITLVETWTEPDDRWDAEQQEYVEAPVPESATHTFTIDVLDLTNTSGTVSAYLAPGEYSKSVTLKLRDLPANAEIEKVSDGNKNGGSYISGTAAGRVTLYVYGAGTHTIKLKAYGKVITCKVVLRALSLKRTAAVKDTGGLVAYPGQKSVLAVKLTGVKSPRVTWTTTNAKVATVNKKGVVKARKKGRCLAKAKVGDATVKVQVEVTSKGAYQAVRNGFADMRTKLTYSQPNRMAAMCRDCSSFVSRCYWDASKGRHITLIGDAAAASWAYNAAAQAQWLNNRGKRISWGACPEKKLRPGDTIYFETDYAGKDASQWRYIDHAALYVGNGLYLNTGGYGGKGTVGLARYGYGNVKFIGRPCA